MAIIPEQFMNAVVAIGIDQFDADGKRIWIGSGFIVERKELQNSNFSTYYIITNKHVIGNLRQIFMRFNSLSGAFVKDYNINLYDNMGHPLFSAHPNQGTDIIAIQFAPQALINDMSIWGAFEINTHTLTLEQMQRTGVEEGSLVYALGFPMNLVYEIKSPFCRLGCVSRIRDAFLLAQNTPIFLIDAQTFPGNSGGPIISRPEPLSIMGTPSNNSSNLIGILSAYLPYKDVLISQQTGEVQMVQTENSGLTIVHPVDRIKEVVEMEWQRNEQIRLSQQPQQFPPLIKSEGATV